MAEHGTVRRYKTGCRCMECVAANSAYCAQKRALRHERAAADPRCITHGVWGSRDYGCRCEVCTTASREYWREYYGREPRKTWTEDEILTALYLYATAGPGVARDAVDVSYNTLRKWAAEHGVEPYRPSPVHGSRATYSRHGCRCEVCVAAYYADVAKRRARRRQNMENAPHGTESGYSNWGCRCEPCKVAGSIQNRRTRERRLARQQQESS